jgi:hypothetical protein
MLNTDVVVWEIATEVVPSYLKNAVVVSSSGFDGHFINSIRKLDGLALGSKINGAAPRDLLSLVGLTHCESYAKALGGVSS